LENEIIFKGERGEIIISTGREQGIATASGLAAATRNAHRFLTRRQEEVPTRGVE
jgi:hypothetical protein